MSPITIISSTNVNARRAREARLAENLGAQSNTVTRLYFQLMMRSASVVALGGAQ